MNNNKLLFNYNIIIIIVIINKYIKHIKATHHLYNDRMKIHEHLGFLKELYVERNNLKETNSWVGQSTLWDTFPLSITRYSTKATWRRVYLARSLKVCSPSWQGSHEQTQGAAGHIDLCRDVNASVQLAFSLFVSLGLHPMEWYHSSLGSVLPYQLKKSGQ